MSQVKLVEYSINRKWKFLIGSSVSEETNVLERSKQEEGRRRKSDREIEKDQMTWILEGIL